MQVCNIIKVMKKEDDMDTNKGNEAENKFNKEVGRRIFGLRNQLKMSRADLGQKVGMHETTVKKYEDGNVKSVGTDKLAVFAAALGSSIEYLMGWDECVTLSSVKVSGQLVPVDFKKKIPILGRISAGLPLFAEEHISGYEDVENPSLDYALVVKGDSMIGARIFEGDIVYVTKECDYENGDIVIALINGYDATIKRFYKYDNEVILKPENPTMKEQRYKLEEVMLIGKVKEVKFKVQ